MGKHVGVSARTAAEIVGEIERLRDAWSHSGFMPGVTVTAKPTFTPTDVYREALVRGFRTLWVEVAYLITGEPVSPALAQQREEKGRFLKSLRPSDGDVFHVRVEDVLRDDLDLLGWLMDVPDPWDPDRELQRVLVNRSKVMRASVEWGLLELAQDHDEHLAKKLPPERRLELELGRSDRAEGARRVALETWLKKWGGDSAPSEVREEVGESLSDEHFDALCLLWRYGSLVSV